MHSQLARIPARLSCDHFETALPIPTRLEGLRHMAYNLYWTWNPQAREIFKRIDGHIWAREHNPIRVLESRADWQGVLDNPSFMAEAEDAIARFDQYMAEDDSHWFGRLPDEDKSTFAGPIAYFCAEFGMHESLAVYSGGLGVLAGDHLKAASDLGLPLVGVGLFYRQGYFRQSIDADGHQEHAYPQLDPTHLPISRVLDPQSGRPLTVGVPLPDREVRAAVWMVPVGRVPLLLLDSDIPDNSPSDRPITGQLYVRGREMRLHQEILLGVGGVRALRALDIDPSAWHLNEGHSAFMLVERMREATRAGASSDEAMDQVRKDSVFTIHTPVSAGNERFDASLARRLSHPLLEGSGVDADRILELGRGVDTDPGTFDMTAFSLRCATASNAVSQLHAATANDTWSSLGREILGITNGVHSATWLGPAIRNLLGEHGTDLLDLDAPRPGEPIWDHIDDLGDEALWAAHQKQKKRMILFVRKRLREQLARHGEAPDVLEELEHVLDENTLTIGFARRFATYKRASLLFRDPERLTRLLRSEDRPMVMVFAGKAHPADRPGQKVIQEIFEHSRSDRFRGRVFILEDYDMRIGRFLTQGCDVWLNNPRRPLEASGTSGMKAAANGVPNCSVLDGWWDEGFADDNGWAIGGRDMNPDEAAQDHADVESLYQTLENQVVPLYYDRDATGRSGGWIRAMRRAMATSLWQFSMARCVEEYTQRMYLGAARAGK